MAIVSLRGLSAIVLLFTLLPVSWALKFDIVAHLGHNKYERCIRNFVQKDTLVVVTAISDGNKGDGQVVDMHVRAAIHSETAEADSLQIIDTAGNGYGIAKDIVGEKRMAFTSHVDAAFDVCFENRLNAKRSYPHFG